MEEELELVSSVDMRWYRYLLILRKAPDDSWFGLIPRTWKKTPKGEQEAPDSYHWVNWGIKEYLGPQRWACLPRFERWKAKGPQKKQFEGDDLALACHDDELGLWVSILSFEDLRPRVFAVAHQSKSKIPAMSGAIQGVYSKYAQTETADMLKTCPYYYCCPRLVSG